MLWASLIWFLVTSTGYIPFYCASELESQNKPMVSATVQNLCSDSLFIVVLASGYSSASGFPAVSQLELNSLGRLAEGIRLKGICERATLVVSGAAVAASEASQAEITKHAAVELGINGNEIKMLNKTSSTAEEASEFVRNYGKNRNVILVTDALHMPRAARIFSNEGIHVFPAPTNFKMLGRRRKWPSLSIMKLSDAILHEYLANIKYQLNH